jgi:hypothetical protein
VLGRLVLGPHKGGGVQCQRVIGARVAEQLPGQDRGRLDIADHLDPSVLQLVVDLVPDRPALAAVEDGREQLPADLGHALLHLGGDHRG